MILEKDAADDRLSNPNNLANRFGKSRSSVVGDFPDRPHTEGTHEVTDEGTIDIIQRERTGPKLGSTNTPIEVRNTMFILDRMGQSQKSIGEAFGVTQAEVSNIRVGKVKTDSSKTDDQINQIKDLAMTKLMNSLGLLTDEKIAKCKAVEISTVAANMSKIIEKTSPRSTEGTSVNLTIYSPAMRDEKGYPTIDV